MRLTVISHKVCWSSPGSPSGYATDGGFTYQIEALSELFDATTLVVPCRIPVNRSGEMPLQGRDLQIVPLSNPPGIGVRRKLLLPFWLLNNLRTLAREVRHADAVHAPIPGDVGTLGMLLALAFRKPLFVRHCGNWLVQRTAAERFWKWAMERFAGGRNVMLATGGADSAPSLRNPCIHWVFSTSLRDSELRACAAPREYRPATGPRLIVVGRQDAGKGAAIVAEALPLVVRDFPCARLDVVGDGPAIEAIRETGARLGVLDRIMFLGRVTRDRVMELLQGADIFCHPTESEGFPKAVLEALACGLPVVTTPVSVLPMLVGPGAGALISDRTPVGVADGIRRCFSDRQTYLEMSRTAAATASNYSLERWRDEIGGRLRAAWGPLSEHG